MPRAEGSGSKPASALGLSPQPCLRSDCAIASAAAHWIGCRDDWPSHHEIARAGARSHPRPSSCAPGRPCPRRRPPRMPGVTIDEVRSAALAEARRSPAATRRRRRARRPAARSARRTTCASTVPLDADVGQRRLVEAGEHRDGDDQRRRGAAVAAWPRGVPRGAHHPAPPARVHVHHPDAEPCRGAQPRCRRCWGCRGT